MLVSQNTEERKFVVDSEASMHMLSKKDSSTDELDTLRRSRNPTTVVTANGEVETNEDAQVYVHDPSLFVRVQLLDETPAVLPLGKFCSEHGYSYEWKKRRNTTFDKKRENKYVYDGQLRSSCRTRIVIISQQQLGFYIETKGSPGGWGPQGGPLTGGGGPARVPNLRVCEHPLVSGVAHAEERGGREGRINVLPWYRLSRRGKNLQRVAQGGKTRLPVKRVSGHHVVRGTTVLPTYPCPTASRHRRQQGGAPG